MAAAGGELLRKIDADREAGQQGIDTTALEVGLTDSASVQRFRLEARVPLPDGAWLRVSRSVDLGGRSRDGLPWRTFYTQHGFEAVPRKNF